MIVKKVKYSSNEIIPTIEITDNIESILQKGNVIECYSPSVKDREHFTL